MKRLLLLLPVLLIILSGCNTGESVPPETAEAATVPPTVHPDRYACNVPKTQDESAFQILTYKVINDR